MDMTNLPPAPWQCDERVRCMALYSGEKVNCFDDLGETIAYIGWGTLPAFDLPMKRAAWEFAALARQAFDVMMRRGWYAQPDSEKWYVFGLGSLILQGAKQDGPWPDPFTALVEADRWYVEHIERKPSPAT